MNPVHPRQIRSSARSSASLAAILLAGAIAALWAPPAGAAEVVVGVLGLDAVETPEAAAQAVTDALRQRAAQVPSVRVVAGKDLVEVKLVFGCMDEKPSCLAQAGRSLGVDRLIYGSVRQPGGSSGYTVVLKQLDVRSARVEKFISDVVPARVLHAGSTELGQLVQKWLSVLLVSGLHGGLRISSQPPGAEVTLDGVRVGQTPLDLREVLTGSHVAVIALFGYEQMVRTFEVHGGVVHEMQVTLARRSQKKAELPAEGRRPEPPAAVGQGKQERQEKINQPGQPGQAGQPGHPGSVELVPTPAKPGEGEPVHAGRDRGKPLRLVSYFLIGAAAIAGGVAIYTWRTYTGEEQPAKDALNSLEMNLPGASQAVNDFFRSQEQLSSCEPPVELTSRAMSTPMTTTFYNDYLDHCRRGRKYASATTGLVATMGSLALLGVASYILGDRLSHHDHKPGDAPRKTSWLYTPRLTVISPTMNATGGGLDLSFQF